DTGHGFFSEGLAANYTADYKTEYIDTTGKVVAQYDFGRELEDGMAYVEKDDKPGFMDKTGKLAFTLQIPAGYRVLMSGMFGPRFHQGVSAVRIYKEGEYAGEYGENAVCGLIDKQGNQILPYQYKDISVYGAYGTVSDGTRWGIFQNPAYQSPTPTPTPTPTPAPSTEAPSSWAAESVNSAIAAGLVPEALQSKYTQSITRAEFCALATALYEKATGAEITGRTKFNDTTDVNVEKMASLNVVTGTGNGSFSPNNPLTREQAATMLARLADALGKPMTAQAPSFTDASAISSWAANAVGQVQGAKIMGDVGNGNFNPAGSYTREQSIVTMARMLELVK
ncbi:MAG: hypothetical protein HFE97_10370, partial [Oscillospiraceae bacterium]|nr:hypothetical protein [Oscillospiraceae bacterium]